ncbi:GreA/GreB family elongation factor [Chryseolinea sp. H1M3-3]|jgi:regulator of nucleoside diphosphate kinase|uniref:GreA/GreB family elongation factor n=1 Tax=Chryseolinea sp. H1M3-3 TaxID=3034144 RepID=UPI0023ED415A|nr:GreA/GreB family elongation factor [Chryseolinea sp. H1M3-3]
MMESKIFVTINDYQRLIGLIEFSSIKFREDEGASQLLRGLKTANMVAQENISNKIVTMNSRILLRDVLTGREKEITLAYPHDADSTVGKISVLSRAGAALLGRKEGDVVMWRTPGGIGEFEITKVTFQPEAAGDYYL